VGRQQRRRAERRHADRRRQKQAPPKRNSTPSVVAGVVVILLAIVGVGYAATHHTATPTPTPIPTEQSLAPTIDRVQCNAGEMLAYHIHQHLTMYDHGKQVPLPSSIGIPGSESAAICLYWLHVHALYPGIIHVESPTTRTYTLGQFFDVWKATKNDAIPRGDAYVLKLEQAAKHGQVTVFVEKRRWKRSYRSVPLTSHESITIEIGKPVVAPKIFRNWGPVGPR
jgi:hypothetical protein